VGKREYNNKKALENSLITNYTDFLKEHYQSLVKHDVLTKFKEIFGVNPHDFIHNLSNTEKTPEKISIIEAYIDSQVRKLFKIDR
jgi:hypothetical protein